MSHELAFSAFSGETMRQRALAGTGTVCLANFMTKGDQARGDLVQLLARDTMDLRQAVNTAYYRDTALPLRITAFLNFMAQRL